ncbi:MAG: hypothetical protein IPJ34_27845 [Myxococcales bacterium]|nr:hypothetical protein [Myxococcales bacterium]
MVPDVGTGITVESLSMLDRRAMSCATSVADGANSVESDWWCSLLERGAERLLEGASVAAVEVRRAG